MTATNTASLNDTGSRPLGPPMTETRPIRSIVSAMFINPMLGWSTRLLAARSAAASGGWLAALLVAGVAAGCGSSSAPRVVLDTKRVELSVQAAILQQRHLPASVSCPDNVQQKQGVRFTCFATVHRRRYPVLVNETNGSGHVTYIVR